MCGIAGVVDLREQPAPVNRDALARIIADGVMLDDSSAAYPAPIVG